MPAISRDDPHAIAAISESVRHVGYAVVEGVLEPAFIEATREAMYRVQTLIERELGTERLRRAGELGILRLMMKYDDHFLAFLEFPEVLAVLDQTVSETCVLHTQNGFILPSCAGEKAPSVAQNQFHRDFPRHLMGYVASINVFFPIDPFTESNGATLVVPGTHQKPEPPSREYLAARAVAIQCGAGAMIVFDSTLWHASGTNVSGRDRLAVNMQFTRSWIKQQIDYVRALGEPRVRTLKPRTQQLLGGYTRVVTSLDEYYRPEEERLYRRGQG